MSGSNPLDCGCEDDACASLPSAFVRLRFYLGKPMGVADFNDLQFYPAAKVRFHNQRLHGSGVVLGLRLGAFNGSSTVLRVARGAALDRCGREIVVGYDQCIDVAAWAKRERARRQAIDPATTWPTSDLDANGKLPLAVVVRYQECATAAEPAPRDPCGCDDGGAQFGRVREGFDLELMSQTDAQPYAQAALFPAAPDLDRALAQSFGPDQLAAKLEGLVTGGVIDQLNDAGWLLVGWVSVTLDAQANVSQVDVASPQAAPILLETAALQELLLRQLAASQQPGALLADAPTVESATLAQDSATPGNYVLTLSLSRPIVLKTVDPGAAQFAWTQFDPTNGWGNQATLTAAADASGRSIVLTLAASSAPSFLAADGLYRLSYVGHQERPIVDAQMRPLRPLQFSWDFRVTLDASGKPTVGPAPFAV